MLTSILVAAVSALATVAVVLGVLLVRRGGGDAAPAAPVEPVEPARPAPPARADDLMAELTREPARLQASAAAPAEETFLEALRPSAARGPGSRDLAAGHAAEQVENGPDPESPEHEDVHQHLDRTLRAARAIPDADAALVLTGYGEPVVGTAGLESQEAERLVTSLPAVTARTRLLAITFDYSSAPRGVGVRRIESGIAVPLTSGATGLVAVFSRSPECTFGDRHIELLEGVAEQASPGLAALAPIRPAPPSEVEVLRFDEVRARSS